MNKTDLFSVLISRTLTILSEFSMPLILYAFNENSDKIVRVLDIRTLNRSVLFIIEVLIDFGK
jgi:hypothetical protein